MVQENKDNDLRRAREIVERAKTRHHNAVKRAVFEAAKKARKWRLESRLEPLYIVDSIGCGRIVRRG